MTLRASWERTEKHLREARSLLGDAPRSGDEGGTVAGFDDWLTHNELELALDELEMLGGANPVGARYWSFLTEAAREMRLETHVARYLGWRKIAAEHAIVWSGDLEDDCTALWAGLTLRAEEMEQGVWWWSVYDRENDDLEIASSNSSEGVFASGAFARSAAELAARNFLGISADGNSRG